MNKCIFMGTLARDNQLAILQGGGKVIRNSIAVYMGKDKSGKSMTTYVPVSFYNNAADFVNQYFNKGKAILVEGRYRSWKGDNNVYYHEFVAEKVNFVAKDFEEKPAQSQYNAPQQTFESQQTYSPNQFDYSNMPVEINSDDLPF